jgi:hypothetical protein
MKSIRLLVALGLLIPACGWESDGAARLAERYADPGGAADIAAEEVAPHEVDLGDVGGTGLAGRWAVQVVVTGTMAPIGVEWAFTETSWFLTDLADGASTASLVYCDQVNDVPKSPNPTKQPPALYDVLVAKPLELALTADGVGASTVVWTWGLDVQKLGDVGQKPEALDATSDAVTDEDGDGQEGVTLEVLVKKDLSHYASRYLARWERWDLLAGSLSEDGLRVEGALSAEAVEFALGADKDIVNRPSNLVVDPGDVHSWRLRRVPADYTCADLRQDATALFPPL